MNKVINKYVTIDLGKNGRGKRATYLKIQR